MCFVAYVEHCNSNSHYFLVLVLFLVCMVFSGEGARESVSLLILLRLWRVTRIFNGEYHAQAHMHASTHRHAHVCVYGRAATSSSENSLHQSSPLRCPEVCVGVCACVRACVRACVHA